MGKKFKNKIESFWNQWSDRRYMSSVIYPSIGEYLKNKKTKRVLDIGAEWFNVNNKDLFSNDEIKYWVIDINKKPERLKCDKFLNGSIIEITTIQKNLKSYFDVVISFGVLGWYKFEEGDVKKYLKRVSEILKPDGLFLLKLDTHITKGWERKFKISPKLISKYFIETSAAGLPKKKILKDKDAEFLFLTLKKNQNK